MKNLMGAQKYNNKQILIRNQQTITQPQDQEELHLTTN